MEDDTHIHNMCDGHSVPLPHQVLNDCKLRLQNDKTPFYIFLYNLLFNGKKNTFSSWGAWTISQNKTEENKSQM